MAYGKRATWDVIREIDFGDLSDTYVVVGVPTTKAVRTVKIANATNATIYFTDDNINNKLKLPANSYELWDVTANKAMGDLPQFIEVGTQFYARYITGSAPTSGWVSIELLIVESGS